MIKKSDVCVYGGTAAGMVAAVAVAKENRSVVVIEPSRALGGMVGGGIRILRDTIHPGEIGGLTRMMMKKDIEIGGGAHDRQPEFRRAFRTLASEYGIEVIVEHRVSSAEKEAKRLSRIVLDKAPPEADGCPIADPIKTSAITIEADIFIDASYEGDLMSAAGVSYAIDPEPMEQYSESVAGLRNPCIFNVDPHTIPGDPSSGLLPMIDPEPLGEARAGSRYLLAYNYRLQFVPQGQGTPIGEPDNYDPAHYELLHRALKTDPSSVSWPCGNYNRKKLLSGGIPGRQADYPDGTWAERARIWREWTDHVKIMHMVTGCKNELRSGEYPDSNDFPDQLYVRLARRLNGRYTLTQHDLMLQTDIDDPVGLGYGWYGTIDIYPSHLAVTADGKVASVGEVMPRVAPGPYRIPYRTLTPKKDECGNLLVAVCISGSHVAMANVRMETTYMLIGESAGIAAVRALEEKVDVQDISMPTYQQKLIDAGQILMWDGTAYGARSSDHYETWWETNPQDYARNPVSDILKGDREPTDFVEAVNKARCSRATDS